ncbi:DDE-type integrase/transposase/recombinase [Ruegeria atlantica]|uniref:DDE-type integrase/transposase/recombinase n=1 Tax=Ruegeria atlantica TaxID=81569 RepID=UPI002494D8FA|nr:DDE-type integrase/transposase/recombinase [Ruegeria atlantica]
MNLIHRLRPADKWHLVEVVVPINGREHWLWRTVDGNGDALDILVQPCRNKTAAMRLFRKPFKTWATARDHHGQTTFLPRCDGRSGPGD